MTTWQIGESGTTIALDGTGKGEVTFTVTNAGTAPHRAVLTINALDGAAESWFTVPDPQRAVATIRVTFIDPPNENAECP